MFEFDSPTLFDDTAYLVLSAVIGLVGSVLLLKILCRVKATQGYAKYHWVIVAGILGGCVNWTAHYAALVGLDRDLAHSFDPNMTVAALFASIFMMGASVSVFGSKIRHASVAGGAMIGLTIALTHHVAMVSYYVQAFVVPNDAVIMLTTSGACLLGGAAAYFLGPTGAKRARPLSVLSMIACMAASHYGDVLSTSYVPDQRVQVPLVFVSDEVMLLAVTTVLGLLVIAGWSIYMIDKQSRLDSLMRVEHLEAHDSLTGLPNRRGVRSELAEVLAHAAREGSPVAVMCFNLRRFRNVNDVHGYAAGDGVLVTLAGRLTRQLRGTARIGRIAGDEFVAVLRAPDTTEDVVALARRIINIVSQPLDWRGTPISVATNVGIAMFPHDGDDADILMSKASLALERTRRRERENVLFYDLKRDEATRTKSALALELKDAMSRGELELYYQRQNSSDTRELIGFEVLLRWNHPTRGLVSPSEFIPIAEAYGYIPMIGEWVLRKACEEAAGWTHPFRIAVNVAADQLCNPRLPEIVAGALAASKLDPSRLELEMTETGIIADPERALAIILQLKDMGVKLAMDDYGTGSSSLSTLQSYPFDKIKIDRSFVTTVSTNPQAAAIVHSTVILGQSLNIAILAEGVETEGTLLTLRRLGCTEVQGFLFGRPMPARDIAEIAA